MSARILLLTTELRPGGAERIVLELASGINRDSFPIMVAALDGRGDYADSLRKQDVEVVDLQAYHTWNVGVLFRLRRLLRDKKIDLLHTHLIHATIVGRLAARPLRLPCVSTSHIVDRRAIRWHFLLNRLTARWCRKEICVSDAVRRFQIEQTGLPESFFEVIHNGIDLTRFFALPSKNNARIQLGMEPGAFYVGALGRFDRQKGFDIFLRAIAKVVQETPDTDIRFALAGYGAEEETLHKEALRLGIEKHILFVGYQTAENFLPALDIAVVPSRWEGFGLVALEALACGIPVIASNVDSLPEIIRPAQDGVLIPPENPSALANAIRKLRNTAEQCNVFAKQGPRRAIEFNQKRMIEAHENLYTRILQTKDTL